ncbi:MAG: alpha-L-fucosidase [Opitutales bacterium]
MQWGMFICWSFSTFSGQEWTPTLDKDAAHFKATGCDTDQWCETAEAACMSYILFLTKHHDGFCLWDTATTHKKVTTTNSPLGVDVLVKLRKSCDKYGLKLALYFSEGDMEAEESGLFGLKVVDRCRDRPGLDTDEGSKGKSEQEHKRHEGESDDDGESTALVVRLR